MRKATTWQEAELKLKLLLKELRWTEEELFAGSDEEGDRGEEDHERKRKKAEEEEEDLLRSNETARKLLYADAPGVVCFPTSKFFDYSNCVAEAKRTKAARPDFKDASLDLFLSSSSSASSSATTGDKTQLQLLAEQRDYKRRRRSYRAKNVHITKRTPIQVTRDFINKRMEELEAILLQQQHEQEQQQTKTLSNEEEPAQARNSSNRRRDTQSNQKRRREAGNEDYDHHRG